jgi:hypothetical protein
MYHVTNVYLAIVVMTPLLLNHRSARTAGSSYYFVLEYCKDFHKDFHTVALNTLCSSTVRTFTL